MEPGPLPPHERSWRHPSELGPTRLDVDDTDRHARSHLVALAGGSLAVLAVAAMVVAMTPRTSSGPVASSATTTPITARAATAPPISTTTVSTGSAGSSASAPASASVASVRSLQLRPPTDALLTSFVAFPHAVTPGPQLGLDGTDIADTLPGDDEMVFVRTEDVTYQLRWDEARRLRAPDGSVIFDADGDLVAHVSSGELLDLVDG